ncbi:MAG: glycosyltransferase family 2 protein [Burkholderiales bacterium]
MIIKMENNRISVAMATYNGEKFLRQQLDSIFSQTCPAKEVIVTDDRSTDNTVKILEEYSQIYPLRYIVNETNLGVVRNFEKAISLCKGKYIALADQDDVWRTDKLAIAFGKMKEIESSHPGIPVLVHSDLCVVDERLNVICESLWKGQKTYPELYKSPEQVAIQNLVTGCTILMNRAALNVTVPFPAEVLMHDWWMAINIIKYGIVVSISEPLVFYRQHGGNQVGFKAASFFGNVNRLFDFGRTVRVYAAMWRMLKKLDFKVSIFKLVYYKFIFFILVRRK